MEKYAILLAYFDKQLIFAKKLYDEAIGIDVSQYDERIVFAMRVPQFYTALEDLFKQIAKSFENHIENMSNFPKEILTRMNIEVPKIRPAVISNKSLALLEKLRAFRRFIHETYDRELDESKLVLIQKKLKKEYASVQNDLEKFQSFILNLSRA